MLAMLVSAKGNFAAHIAYIKNVSTFGQQQATMRSQSCDTLFLYIA